MQILAEEFYYNKVDIGKLCLPYVTNLQSTIDPSSFAMVMKKNFPILGESDIEEIINLIPKDNTGNLIYLELCFAIEVNNNKNFRDI